MHDLLIVGLGNPGKKYAPTRHNIGWMVVDHFVHVHSGKWKKPGRGLLFRALYLESNLILDGNQLHVIKPQTFMNNSGEAVLAASKQYTLQNARSAPFPEPVGETRLGDNVIVIADEYNFPVGKIQLKRGGSSGGHNGIQSIIDELGTEDFWRLRCGIGREFGPGELVDYVLSPFPDFQHLEVEQMISDASDAISTIAFQGCTSAMNIINR